SCWRCQAPSSTGSTSSRRDRFCSAGNRRDNPIRGGSKMKRILILAACTVCVAVGFQAVVAAGGSRGTVVSVTAGKPSEYKFTLSRAALLPTTVTFKVTNRGKLPHQFEVCTEPAGTATSNSCFGDTTKVLKPGQSATL